MKNCPYCGAKYPDEVENCPIDHHALHFVEETPVSAQPLEFQEVISPREQQFWNRMTFRQFAILMVRLQALWLFVNAAIDVIYVPRYINFSDRIYSVAIAKPELFTLLLRMLLNIAVGILIIQKAEKLLSWIVKDLVAEQTAPPGKSAKDIKD